MTSSVSCAVLEIWSKSSVNSDLGYQNIIHFNTNKMPARYKHSAFVFVCVCSDVCVCVFVCFCGSGVASLHALLSEPNTPQAGKTSYIQTTHRLKYGNIWVHRNQCGKKGKKHVEVENFPLHCLRDWILTEFIWQTL